MTGAQVSSLASFVRRQPRRLCSSRQREYMSFQPTLLRFDSIDSTNLEALRQARTGAPEGLCIVAREQTAGRGRLDRKWHSPRDSGLYFSVVLRPRFEMSAWPLITLMAALATVEALQSAC